MTDAPEKIWVGSAICHDGYCDDPSIWKDEASSYETDIVYHSDDMVKALQARIAELEAMVENMTAHIRIDLNE